MEKSSTAGSKIKLKALPPTKKPPLNQVPETESVILTNVEGPQGHQHDHHQQHLNVRVGPSVRQHIPPHVAFPGNMRGSGSNRKKHEEQRVFEFQFQCDMLPGDKAKYASHKEDHDIIRIKMKVKGSSPVSDVDKVKIWRDMQKELAKKYFLRHPDIAVFTFQDTISRITPRGFAVVVNAIQFSDLLDMETRRDLQVQDSAESKVENFSTGLNDNFSTTNGGKTWRFKHNIQIAHSISIPPTHKNSYEMAGFYPAPSATEVREFCLATGGSQKNAEGPGGGDSHHDSVVSGEVSFRLDSTKATAKFCKVSDRQRLHRYQEPETNPHLLRFLLEDVWRLPLPSLVVEMTGSAQGLQLSKEDRADITESIFDVAKRMKGWVVTGGFDQGVMKLMGEGRIKYAPEVPLIGFCSWPMVYGKELLEGSKRDERGNGGGKDKVVVLNRGSKPSGSLCALNPDHSHFIMVDSHQGEKHGQEINLRADLMSVISTFNWHAKNGQGEHVHSDITQHLQNELLVWPGKWHRNTKRPVSTDSVNTTVPCIMICVQGGEGTLRTLSETLDSGVPVILVKGSGGAADLVSDLYERLYEGEETGGGGEHHASTWLKDVDGANKNNVKEYREVITAGLLKRYQSLYNAFIALDRNKNGVIGPAEFKYAVEEMLAESEVGGGVDQAVNEGNPDDGEMDTIREDMSGVSESGRSETDVDEVHTETAQNLMIQYLNVLSDHENDPDKARDVFKAIVANLLGSSTSGGVGAAALIQQKAAKDTPAHAAELLWSSVREVDPLYDYTRPEPLPGTSNTATLFPNTPGIKRTPSLDYVHKQQQTEKKYNLSFTAFVENLALGDLDDQSGSSLLLDVWNKHKIFNSEGQEPHVALAKNKSYIVNILKQKENIVVYDSTLESTSLQTCMCRAIIQRTHLPLELREKLLLCVAWGMLDVTREVLEESNRQKRTRNISWAREEAINKAFSRALKENKKAFVQLFLDYGADIGRFNLGVAGHKNLQAGLDSNNAAAASASTGGWRVFNKLNRVVPLMRRDSGDDSGSKPLDNMARLKFEKLFGLSKKHLKDVEHLRHLLDKKHAHQSHKHMEQPKQRKRYHLSQVDEVLCDLLGNDFEGYIGGFGGPYNDLLIWSVLMGWNDLAMFFWQRCKQPLKMALTSALIYRNMSTSHACLGRDDLKDSFQDYGNRFEALALKLMVTATKDDPMLSLYALERMWPEWKNEDGMHLTNYDIAVRAHCDQFMDRQKNYMCFRAQQERWTGDIRYTGYWGMTPEAWAFMMAIPLFWPLFLFKKFNDGMFEAPPRDAYRRLPAQRRGVIMRGKRYRMRQQHANSMAQDSSTKHVLKPIEAFVLFQIAPVTKFVRQSIVYFIFVILLSYDLLSNPGVSDGGRDITVVSTRPGRIRTLVIVNAIAINIHQYQRIYQVCKVDGLWPNIWSEYFQRFWNRNEFIAIVSYLIGIVIEVWDMRSARNVHAASFVFFWFQLLNTVSVNRNMGPLLVAIGKMFDDIANWLIIFLIVLVGFGGAIHGANVSAIGDIVVCTDALRDDGACVEDKDLIASGLGDSLFNLNWIIRAYFQVFGEFNLDETAEAGLYPMVILMAFAMITNVLMVNLLVAMMGSTYEKVKEMAEVEWMYQMYSTNNEYLIPNQFDAPFNVIKLVLWTWPRGFWAIISGSAILDNKKLRNKAKTEELFDPDSEVEALVERCRDIVMAESETWSGKSRDQSDDVKTKVMLAGEKITKLEGVLQTQMHGQCENLEGLLKGGSGSALPRPPLHAAPVSSHAC